MPLHQGHFPPCVPMAGKYALELTPENPVEIEAELWLDGTSCPDQLEIENTGAGIVIFTALSALQDMLLGDAGGIIEVFPAIPKELSEGGAAFKNLRARGAVLVSSSIKNGQVEYIVLTSLAGGTVKLKSPFGQLSVKKQIDEAEYTELTDFSSFNGCISIEMNAGDTIMISPLNG